MGKFVSTEKYQESPFFTNEDSTFIRKLHIENLRGKKLAFIGEAGSGRHSFECLMVLHAIANGFNISFCSFDKQWPKHSLCCFFPSNTAWFYFKDFLRERCRKNVNEKDREVNYFLDFWKHRELSTTNKEQLYRCMQSNDDSVNILSTYQVKDLDKFVDAIDIFFFSFRSTQDEDRLLRYLHQFVQYSIIEEEKIDATMEKIRVKSTNNSPVFLCKLDDELLVLEYEFGEDEGALCGNIKV